jgi:hypothetical protein
MKFTILALFLAGCQLDPSGLDNDSQQLPCGGTCTDGICAIQDGADVCLQRCEVASDCSSNCCILLAGDNVQHVCAAIDFCPAP